MLWLARFWSRIQPLLRTLPERLRRNWTRINRFFALNPLAGIVLAFVTGASLMWALGARSPAAEAPAEVSAAPVFDAQVLRRELQALLAEGIQAEDTVRVRTALQDWADSVPIPEHILTGTTSHTRRYSPLGQPGGAVRAESRTPAEPVEEFVGPPPILLVARTEGPNAIVADVGFAATPASVEGLRLSPRLRLLGDCGARLWVQGVGSSLPLSAAAREGGATGAWLYEIGTSESECRRLTRGGVERRPPTRDEREGLTQALNQSGRLRLPNGVRFRAPDVADFVALGRASDGGRLYAGVVRAGPGTQMAPPPPRPQVAFVAQQQGAHWNLLWHYYVEDRASRLALAGAFDLEGEGSLRVWFARDAGPGVRLLSVRRGADGVWELAEERVWSAQR